MKKVKGNRLVTLIWNKNELHYFVIMQDIKNIEKIFMINSWNGRETRITDPKEYYDIIQLDTFAKLIQDRVKTDGISTKHLTTYKNLSSGGTGLKELNRVNLINQFYNEKPGHENRALLETLLKNQNPNTSLKEQKWDAVK
jgi:hypothetical protein